MRILVTGSSGRFGAAIVAYLSRGHEVWGLDCRAGPCTTHEGDIRDAQMVAQAVAGVDVVIHTAAHVITRHFPWAAVAFQRRGWQLPQVIDRVYVSQKAQNVLGYAPTYTFETLFDEAEKED